MKLVQAKLKHKNTYMTAWIEKKPGVKKGCFVTLKEKKEALWEVVDLYMECDSSTIHSDWEVGGLSKREH